MKSLCIKTNNSKLLDYLLNELKYIEIKDICFSSNKFKHYQNIIIHYLGNDTSLFYSKISYLLSFMVIDEIEDTFLKRLIFQNYFYFQINEREKILENCYSILSEDYYKYFDEKFKILYNNFYSFIENHKSIIIEGFINFRIKDYFKILDNIINEAVNSYIIEKEYLEFISLLKLYINSQSSNCNIIHLIYYNNQSILVDEDKNLVDTSNELLNNAKYLSDISFSSNDYTLNSLLTLLPKKIYIHLIDDTIDEFINTIQLVFENKTELCIDCDICRIYKKSFKPMIKK